MPTHNDLTPRAADTGRRLPTIVRMAATLVLAASVFLFVLATPPLSYGVWFKTEPVSVGLLGAGAAAALSLLALDLTGHSIGLVLGRRHVQILLAFLAWNALVSAAQAFPGRGWFGTPETGEGILAFLALAMLTMLAMVLWSWRTSRIVLVVAALAAVATIGGMDLLLPLGSPWRLEKYAGYAGLLGPSTALIVLGAVRRPGARILLFAMACALMPVVFSDNKTAIGLLCVVGPAAFFPIRWLARRMEVVRLRHCLAWMPLLVLLVTAAAVATASAWPDYDPLYSVRSRGLLIFAGLLNLRDHPLALLSGFGWGSFNDTLYRHTFLPGVRAFQNGVWDPNWEGIGAGAYHVHNDVFEAVLGGGLIGGILYLLFFAAIVAGARRAMLACGAVAWFLIVGFLCFWYPFLICYPFLALAIAATTAPLNVLRAPVPVPMAGWMRASGAIMAALLVTACVLTRDDANAAGLRLAALNRQDPAEIPTLGTFPPDHGRAGVHLWWLALNEGAFIGRELASGHPPTPAQAQWFARMLQEVDGWTEAGQAGLRLEALRVALRNDLVAGHEHTELAPLRARAMAEWEAAVLRVIRQAPFRTDVAVPFLAHHAAQHDNATVNALCARIDAIQPSDRVCLWYTGLVMLTDPATTPAGLRSMHAALAAHVDAVAPVPKAARDLIEANVPDTPH
jgi:hypothetical protein